MGKRSSPALHIKLPERHNPFTHMSKKPKIDIPDLLIDGSPLPSPTKTEESFEKELDRSRKEFKQFNQDLDQISKTVEKLVEEAPEWFKGIEDIKEKQDNVEECITAAQEKIQENEIRLEKLNTLQYEANDDINNGLKQIQEQLFELLEKHRSARTDVEVLDDNQSRTTEQLDLMLQAIHEYARLIEEANGRIKRPDCVWSPNNYADYESLDLSPFRKGEGSSSYFEGAIYYASRATTPSTSLPTSRSSSPVYLSSSLSGYNSPTSSTSQSPDPSSPLSPTDPPPQTPQPIHPLPYYQLRHQQLLLLGMRRAAVGLKFLLYAKQLNDLKNGCPEIDCDFDLELFGDTTDEFVLANYATRTKSMTFNSKDSDSCTSSDTDSTKGSEGDSNEANSSSHGGDESKVSVTIRKRSHVFHSYDLLRYDKMNLVKQNIHSACVD